MTTMVQHQTAGYLHYWYSDFDEDIDEGQLNELKRNTLITQLAEFNTVRKAAMTSRSKNADKALQMLEDFGNNNGELGGKMGEILSGISSNISGAANSGVAVNGSELSFHQLGLAANRYKTAESEEEKASAAALVLEIGEQLASIITQANSILDDLGSTLRNNYRNYYDYAIQTWKDRKATATATTLIPTALQSGVHYIKWDGSHLNNSAGQQLAQDYLRIQARVAALETFLGGEITVKEANVIAQLAGKIGGTLSNAGGALIEIADAQAINKYKRQLKPLFTESKKAFLKAAVTGGSAPGIHVKTSYRTDEKFRRWLEELDKEEAGSYNKNDVTILFNDNEVALTIGLTVKNYNAKASSLTERTIKIQDSTPLLNILAKVVNTSSITENQIYNIAAGWQEGGEEGMDSRWTDAKDKTYEGSLQDKWRSLIDYAVAANFLDFLAGDGSLGSNNLVLIINGEIFNIGDIIQMVQQDPDKYIKSQGGMQRFRFYRQNTWVGNKPGQLRNTEQAYERSNKVKSALTSDFSSIKIITRLQMGLIASQMGRTF